MNTTERSPESTVADYPSEASGVSSEDPPERSGVGASSEDGCDNPPTFIQKKQLAYMQKNSLHRDSLQSTSILLRHLLGGVLH